MLEATPRNPSMSTLPVFSHPSYHQAMAPRLAPSLPVIQFPQKQQALHHLCRPRSCQVSILHSSHPGFTIHQGLIHVGRISQCRPHRCSTRCPSPRLGFAWRARVHSRSFRPKCPGEFYYCYLRHAHVQYESRGLSSIAS